jgi:prevent-host-death family protein
MSEIPARELRNDVSAVLRRVEGGEALTVSVSGRSVARLSPLATRPTTMPWSALRSVLDRISADEGLRDDLAAVLIETTDDL